MRGLLQLTWLEIKIFLREPMGAIGTLFVPVAMFLILGRASNRGIGRVAANGLPFLQSGLPVMAALFMAISAVISLVTIISIYREGGILKRLRATPLRPYTILSAHVLVKLIFTIASLSLMLAAGRRFYPVGMAARPISFAIALVVTTVSILSIGFVVASVVRTARFAQPLSAIIFYPMIGLSGLFVPVEVLPPGMQFAARLLPMTYAVSLMHGIWNGDSWFAHLGDLGALALAGALFVALSTKVFRWE